MPRIAYMVSRYPFVSHVFILREVEALRRAGVAIDTFTVRRPDRTDLRSEADREADATTFAILPAPLGDLVASHLRALVTRPRSYLSALRTAVTLRGPGSRAGLWQLFYFGEAARLWNECRSRGIHHIHAHHANVASDVALLAARIGGPRWSWSFTMHGSTEFFDVREHRLAEKTARARFVVCVSDHGRSQLMTHVGPAHWEKLRVIHCGIDPDRFPLVDRRERSGELELLTVGRLVPVKGQQLLIEALAAQAAHGLRLTLTIVGDGPSLADLQALAAHHGIAERVRFAGAVGQQEIGGYYERADAFVLPSFAEGIPVVLMEAMATGMPVIASRITGIPELVDDGRSGLLVTPGRLDQLVRALADLAALGAERRHAIGTAGHAKVVAEFSIDGAARRLKATFAEFGRAPDAISAKAAH